MALENLALGAAVGADSHFITVPGDSQKLMTYGEFVAKLAKEMGTPQLNLLHGAVGVSGEAGELLDAAKKYWAYGKPLDVVNVIEELGDIEFYAALVRMLLNLTREQVLAANVEKLSDRYKGLVYSDAAAIERADKAPEVKALDAATGVDTTAAGVVEVNVYVNPMTQPGYPYVEEQPTAAWTKALSLAGVQQGKFDDSKPGVCPACKSFPSCTCEPLTAEQESIKQDAIAVGKFLDSREHVIELQPQEGLNPLAALAGSDNLPEVPRP